MRRRWERDVEDVGGRCQQLYLSRRSFRCLLSSLLIGLLLYLHSTTFPGCSTVGVFQRLYARNQVNNAKDHSESSIRDNNEFTERVELFRKSVRNTDQLKADLHATKDMTGNSLSTKVSRRNATWTEIKGIQYSNVPFVKEAVWFNHSVLLILNTFEVAGRQVGNATEQLECVYSGKVWTKVIRTSEEFICCEHPPFSSQESLYRKRVTVEVDGVTQSSNGIYGKYFWNNLVYGLVLLEESDDVLLFAKGIVTSKKGKPPANLKCLFGKEVETEVVAFCQENFRCRLPSFDIRSSLIGNSVTLMVKGRAFPSVVRFEQSHLSGSSQHSVDSSVELMSKRKTTWSIKEKGRQFHLCACTMLWNSAKFLKEWVIYHSYNGVQRFFIYDNNSDDNLMGVVEELESYNVSRYTWPWIKTQEAGFSHCSIRASSECTWILFSDLDEFVFPIKFMLPSANYSIPPLHSLVRHYDTANKGQLGQLKISCLNFGPSGLTTLPSSGQIVNYICRMTASRRVKSIVRVSAINGNYCSRVHYFELKKGFVSAQAIKRDVVIHHYKFHVWEDFKLKFVRRAATFVKDWHEKTDMESFDRTPGLGSEAVEPHDWPHRFCEVYDTTLRDIVLSTTKFQKAGKLLWE